MKDNPALIQWFRIVLVLIIVLPHTILYRFWEWWHFGPSQWILGFNRNNAQRFGNFVVYGKFTCNDKKIKDYLNKINKSNK